MTASNYIIADANSIVAHLDESDIWHEKTEYILETLEKSACEIVHLDFILFESISVIARRLEQKGKSSLLEALLNKIERDIPSDSIEWVTPFIRDWYEDALTIIKATQGKLNFNDALISVFMSKYGLSYLLSFDKDFDLIPSIIRISDQSDLSVF